MTGKQGSSCHNAPVEQEAQSWTTGMSGDYKCSKCHEICDLVDPPAKPDQSEVRDEIIQIIKDFESASPDAGYGYESEEMADQLLEVISKHYVSKAEHKELQEELDAQNLQIIGLQFHVDRLTMENENLQAESDKQVKEAVFRLARVHADGERLRTHLAVKAERERLLDMMNPNANTNAYWLDADILQSLRSDIIQPNDLPTDAEQEALRHDALAQRIADEMEEK